ncbi:MAG: FAD-binding oxidoreductase [Pseudomonadota bacterium]
MPSTPQFARQFEWHDSLWRRDAAPDDTDPVLSEDITADVTIIGAGFTGLRAASVLAEHGRTVAILEAKQVGWGASGRNGGQVNPMLPFNSPERIGQLVGSSAFERLARASLHSADELFELIERYQIRCDARQNGWLRVLHSAAAHNAAQRDIESWNAIGGSMEFVKGDDVARLSGSPRYQAGVITKRGGAIHPYKLVCGMADVVRRAGGRIFGQTPVQSVDRLTDSWMVRTEHASVTSDWVIVATNGYTGPLVPGLQNSIIPVTPIQVSTEPLPDEVYHSILPKGQTISDSRRVIMYARREPGNRIVYGGLGQLRNGELTGYNWLKRDAVKVFPQLASAKWEHEWGGTIALTDDHLPHVHEPKDKLLVGLGYNGRGVAMSFVTGRTLAERVLGKPHDELDLPVSRIRPFRLRAVKMFGMQTAVSHMRFLDRLEFR